MRLDLRGGEQVNDEQPDSRKQAIDCIAYALCLVPNPSAARHALARLVGELRYLDDVAARMQRALEENINRSTAALIGPDREIGVFGIERAAQVRREAGETCSVCTGVGTCPHGKNRRLER